MWKMCVIYSKMFLYLSLCCVFKISIVYMMIFDFCTILCKEGMSFHGIFWCSQENADVSEKNAWSADFMIENYY